VIVTFAVFWPVLNYDYVSYDDPHYVFTNPQVQSGLTKETVNWAFRTGETANWHPLTWLSLMLDVDLFGSGPRGHHLVNLVLHVANTLLLFLVLRTFTGALWRSAAVAVLFALHPLHVESVAWISERKDVLSTWFGLLTVWAYGAYARSRGRQALKWYLLAGLAFALGLMSKPMLVTLPFVLLLLDYWPLRRLDITTPQAFIAGVLRMAREKIPLFLLTVISCVVTFVFQKHGGAVQTLTNLSIGERLGNALVSYVRYLEKTFWPADLCILYPFENWQAWQILSAAAILIALCLASLWFGRKLPFLPVGWFWFFGTMIPVIGLVQVGDQSMADRYTYLPLIGIFIVLAWGIGEIVSGRKWNPAVVGSVTAAVLIACVVQTRDQLSSWRDSEKLFRRAIERTTGNDIAYNGLGQHYHELGQMKAAEENYRAALHWNPNNAGAHNNLGAVLASKGLIDEAMHHYTIALQLDPNDADAHNNLGNALRRRDRTEEAIVHYEAALRIRPNFAEAHYNLGNTLVRQGKTGEGIEHYRSALRINPAFAEAHCNLGTQLARAGQREEALVHLTEALKLKPDFAEARRQLQLLVAPVEK